MSARALLHLLDEIASWRLVSADVTDQGVVGSLVDTDGRSRRVLIPHASGLVPTFV